MIRPGLRTACMLLVTLPVMCVSCRTVKFYTQAVGGQLELMTRARPIAEVRAAPDMPKKLQRQLALVEELRGFAHDTLKLPTHRQYRSYADIGRRFVVWNVVAAPEFSVEAKTWTYPFVGKLKYRGYFREADARREAERVKALGYDVAVGGVRVYSTLGLFSDPVLNTFVHEDDAELAETLFHELTHARFFVGGDTDFNEAYATAAAQFGVREWLRSKGDMKALTRYEDRLRRDAKVLDLLKSTRARLGVLYAKRDTMPAGDMRREKVFIFKEARERHAAMQRRGDLPGDAPLSKNLNNARLAALATYHDLVPAFTRLFHGVNGDWEEFHQAVEAMKPLTKAQRKQQLEGLAEAAPERIPPAWPNPS